jgi:hypothetical protein
MARSTTSEGEIQRSPPRLWSRKESFSTQALLTRVLVGSVVSQLSCCYGKIHDISILREEGFYWDHSFRCFNLSWERWPWRTMAIHITVFKNPEGDLCLYKYKYIHVLYVFLYIFMHIYDTYMIYLCVNIYVCAYI